LQHIRKGTGIRIGQCQKRTIIHVRSVSSCEAQFNFCQGHLDDWNYAAYNNTDIGENDDALLDEVVVANTYLNSQILPVDPDMWDDPNTMDMDNLEEHEVLLDHACLNLFHMHSLLFRTCSLLFHLHSLLFRMQSLLLRMHALLFYMCSWFTVAMVAFLIHVVKTPNTFSGDQAAVGG
jgi:hypothetical protein